MGKTVQSLRGNSLVAVYFLVAMLANGLVGVFGPPVLVLTGLVLIPFELSSRDLLHERWHGSGWRMGLLVGSGAMLSCLVSPVAVAVASGCAFAASGFVDFVVYSMLLGAGKRLKMNASNVASAVTDSVVFQLMAFGEVVLWVVIVQSSLKIFGGLLFVWWFCRKGIE